MEDCDVCFLPYDETDRRPRVLPCGHSFCSNCIQCYMTNDKLVCPACRREHFAKDATDFPINYGMEKYLQFMASAPPMEDTEGISELLRLSMEQRCKDMEALRDDIRGDSSQMQGYKSQMNIWKEEHQSLMEFHQTCAKKHHEVITCICKENQTVDDRSAQGHNILQEIRTSVNDLHSANTSTRLSMSLEKSKSIYDSAQEWHSDIQDIYPNCGLIIRSQQLKQQSRYILEKLRTEEWKRSTMEDPGLKNTATSAAAGSREQSGADTRLFSLQDKMQSLLADLETLHLEQMTSTDEVADEEISETDEMSFLNVSDLKALPPYLRLLVESNRVFAVQRREREIRYARISLDNCDDICIHALCKDISVPVSSIFIQHGDLVGDDTHPGLTFLDLAAEGKPLGRLRIRLIPEGNFPLNFHRLCTGEVGPSYVQSRILDVINRGTDNEFVTLGGNESNGRDGEGVVVPGVDWELEWDREGVYGIKECEAGSVVASDLAAGPTKIKGFFVFTKDNMDTTFNCCFGKVEEGLEVLKEAISCYDNENITKVVIADCGVILPHS